MQVGQIEKQSAMVSSEKLEFNFIQNKNLEKANIIEERKQKENKDVYTSSIDEKKEPSGLYRVVNDANGNKKIEYDKIEKTDKADKQAKTEKEKLYYVNTDKVDREIEKLKKQEKDIAQQLAQLLSSGADSYEVEKLKEKMERIENELSMKDTESYRKANAEHHL